MNFDMRAATVLGGWVAWVFQKIHAGFGAWRNDPRPSVLLRVVWALAMGLLAYLLWRVAADKDPESALLWCVLSGLAGIAGLLCLLMAVAATNKREPL